VPDGSVTQAVGAAGVVTIRTSTLRVGGHVECSNHHSTFIYYYYYFRILTVMACKQHCQNIPRSKLISVNMAVFAAKGTVWTPSSANWHTHPSSVIFHLKYAVSSATRAEGHAHIVTKSTKLTVVHVWQHWLPDRHIPMCVCVCVMRSNSNFKSGQRCAVVFRPRAERSSAVFRDARVFKMAPYQ
jgi:hypothetical protein